MIVQRASIGLQRCFSIGNEAIEGVDERLRHEAQDGVVRGVEAFVDGGFELLACACDAFVDKIGDVLFVRLELRNEQRTDDLFEGTDGSEECSEK